MAMNTVSVLENANTGKLDQNQKGLNGVAYVHIRSTDEVDMATVQDYDTITANAAADYDTWDLSMFDELVFTVSGATTDTITVSISPDGTNFAAIEPIDMASRQGAGATAVGNGIYRIELNCQKVRFTSSGTEAKTIAWSAKSTKRMTSVA